MRTPLFNGQLRPILQQKTIPTVFEFDPVFLIRRDKVLSVALRLEVESGSTFS